METGLTSNGPSILGARIGGGLVAASGLATAIIQGFVTKTAWMFGVAPGFTMAGHHIGLYVHITSVIAGLVWLALGVLMALMAVKRFVLVVAVGLVATAVFLLWSGIEYSTVTMHWTMPHPYELSFVILLLLLPLVIVIGLGFCVWLARSGGMVVQAVTMVVLMCAAFLAGSSAFSAFALSSIWVYSLFTSGLFTLGWVVMIGTVKRSGHTWPGLSVIGAVAGGALVAFSGVVKLLIQFHDKGLGWAFGVIPGVNEVFPFFGGASYILGGRIAAIAYIVLGVLMMVLVLRYRAVAAGFGVAVVAVFLAEPGLEWIIRVKLAPGYHSSLLPDSLWVAIMPVVLAVGVGLALWWVLRPGDRRPGVASIAAFVLAGSLAFGYGLSGGDGWRDVLEQLQMAAPFIVGWTLWVASILWSNVAEVRQQLTVASSEGNPNE